MAQRESLSQEAQLEFEPNNFLRPVLYCGGGGSCVTRPTFTPSLCRHPVMNSPGPSMRRPTHILSQETSTGEGKVHCRKQAKSSCSQVVIWEGRRRASG